MPTALDVAAYILAKAGPLSSFKLQKLLFYAEGWTLAWEGRDLFPDEVQAWVNGPVVKSVYEAHRGQYTVGAIEGGHADALSEADRRVVDEVIGFYGRRTADWLVELTHHEPPWRKARVGVAEDDRSTRKVEREDMRRYFGSIDVPRHQLPEELMRGLDLVVNTPPDELDELVDFDPEAFQQWVTTSPSASYC